MIEVPIPSTLKVGGHDYTIRADEQTNDVLDAADAWGLHRCGNRQLLLHTTVPPQEGSKVFLHECIHAITDVYWGHHMEERDVTTLAQGMLQIMEELGIRFVLSEKAK